MLIILVSGLLIYKKIEFENIMNKQTINKVNNLYDIIRPKFSINNEDENILITAKGGNFLNENEILLQNDVLFKSDRYQISSNEVLFNKKDQTAKSNVDSLFNTETSKIKSQGFSISENGNVIEFNGKTTVIFFKWKK